MGPTSDLSLLRRNVKALYEDARSHMVLERDAARVVGELQHQLVELQRAFRQLAEASVVELEGLAADVERQSGEISELARVETRVRAVEQHAERLSHWQSHRSDESLELARLQRAEADRERFEARVESELREIRTAAEHDRTSLQKATRALNAATASVEERQALSDAAIRQTRESVAQLSARQAVLQEEVAALAEAMHEATLGGGGILLPTAEGGTRGAHVREQPRMIPPSPARDRNRDETTRHHTAAPPPPTAQPPAPPPTAGLAAGLASGAAAEAGATLNSGARREAAVHRLAEAHQRLEYEDALAAARSSGRQRRGR